MSTGTTVPFVAKRTNGLTTVTATPAAAGTCFNPCVTPDQTSTTAESRGIFLGLEGLPLPTRRALDFNERNNTKEVRQVGSKESNHAPDDVSTTSSSCTSTASSLESIHQDHGMFQDDQDVPWKGCVCGNVHERPIKVFWIQCEGQCQSWYNVTPPCVRGLTEQEAANVEWTCNDCQEYWQQHPSLHSLLQQLSPDVLYRILEFTARPYHRAHELCQVGALCRASRFAVTHESFQGVWGCILKEYQQPTGSSVSMKRKASIANVCASSRRASKRQRKPTNFLSVTGVERPVSPRRSIFDNLRRCVQEQHILLVGRTDEAFYNLEELADPFKGGESKECSAPRKTLTLSRLKYLLRQHAPIDVNRLSPCTGRTMLQVICAGEVSEGVILSCMQHLLSVGADPNIFSTQETPPMANKPALYFAIARAMPNVVATLVKAGAKLDVIVRGHIRLTFDTSKTVEGVFTPLKYAQTMERVELLKGSTVVPPYWATRVKDVVKVLENASFL